MKTLEIEAMVRDKNQITIPRLVAERHRIEPGARIVIVDVGTADEFVVRVLRRTYAGALTDAFGVSGDDADTVESDEKRELWS